MSTAVKKALEDEPPVDLMEAARQDEVNRAVYNSRSVYLYYLSKAMLPVEMACLHKYPGQFVDRDVLDVGVGAGRTARYLSRQARRYESIDYSPVMVRYMKKHLPEISVREADFRDLSVFNDAEFDAVLATANVIDALSHVDRLRALRESARVLRPGGLLAFSTHNINFKAAFSGPKFDWSWNPMKLGINGVKYSLGSWNHSRVAPLRTRTSEYALLNDTGHFYSCLHYYVGREVVARQLAGAGMTLLDVFDRAGRELAETEDDSENPWLFYVARRD